MAYTDQTRVETWLPGINSATSVTTLITQNIIASDAIVNSYVGNRYDVSSWTSATTTVTPPIIIMHSTNIAAYLTVRSLYTRDSVNLNDNIKEFYDKTIESLERIGDGTDSVIDGTGQLVAIRRTGTMIKSGRQSYTPVFDMDSPETWAVDSDLLDTIDSDRE